MSTLLHGGRREAAMARHPEAPSPLLDLSTGINPVPYPFPALPADCFARLPEPEALARLEGVALAAYGAGPGCGIVAAPGTQILISLLPRLLSPGRVAVVSPTYGEHALAWRLAGHGARAVASPEAVAAGEVGVLCQPNNPDGAHWPGGALMQVAERAALLVVDEAFADFGPAESLVPSLPHPRIVVLRSFGKAYGLAGVRLGFALSAPAWATRIADALGPWAVSGPALAIGTAALADADWRAAAAARLARDAARLDQMLVEAGRPVIGGTHLFRLCRSPGAAADADALARRGVLVRHFPEQDDRLRFGLPGDAGGWERLADALRALG